MVNDSRTPVIVGVGQLNQRTDRPEDALEPVDLMVEVARLAAADAGATALLGSLDAVRVVNLLSWRYADPGRLVAERVGATDARTAYTEGGGQIAGTLLARTAADIEAGRVDIALLTGGEAWRTRTAFKRAGDTLPWSEQAAGVAPDETIGSPLDMWHPAEAARGIRMPVQVYPLFEHAFRGAAGRGVAEHSEHLGRLWARFSEVAAANPYAWDRAVHAADEIATPGPGNRMVGFPYTKLMCSNERVDQAAALVMCSAERARTLRIPRHRWVFPHAVVDAQAPHVSERPDLSSSTMVRACGEALWKRLGCDSDDIAHVDLYSCFPSAVEVQAAELGFGLDRQLTVTGGMRFAGGPWNNYPMHAFAAMVDTLRRDPGARGLVSANGGYISKLAVTVLSTEPAASGFWHDSPQARIDAEPRRAVDPEPDGVATVETYTVMHDRSGEPTEGIVSCSMPDGRRAWGLVHGDDALAEMTRVEMIGRRVAVRPDGTATID
jgi:acetyl-CoA C-acetyltransferase